MEFKALLKGAARNWANGKTQLTLECENASEPDIEKLMDKPLRVKAVQWREKRSLNANAYYWLQLSKLAELFDVSKPRMHNFLLRKYGAVEMFDGAGAYIRIPDTEKAEETALEASTHHIRPTSQVIVGKDGVNYRTYIMLKGSSDYNTKEMSELIDGLVWECKESGIETLPPEEIDRMMQSYEQERLKYEKTVEHIHG